MITISEQFDLVTVYYCGSCFQKFGIQRYTYEDNQRIEQNPLYCPNCGDSGHTYWI